MGWWRGVLRSVWSALSKEVREHVGTDHLGNKYYYIAEYKNWRGESEERLRVAARPGRVAVAAVWSRAADVLGSEGLVVALGDEVWTESSKICQRGLGSIGKGFEPVPSLVFSSRLSSEFTFPCGAQWRPKEKEI
ncbi:hypothetical protein A6R68_15521, partial [Neotoma lepida]